MKKLLFCSLVICMALFASCSKDSSSTGNNGGGGGGNITVGKKISELYHSEENYAYVSYDNGITWTQIGHYESDNQLKERWHWNNDKITSIDYYHSGQYEYTYDFSYNSDGLVSQIVRDWEGVEKTVISYNNQTISKFEQYWDGIMQSAWKLEYSNGKISRIKCEYWNPDNILAKSQDNILSKLLNIDVKNFADNFNSKDQLPYIDLTWSGNNVRKVELNASDYPMVESYVYDNKKNPYYGGNSLMATLFIDADFSILSENNVTNSTLTENDETEHYTYSYNYYEDYPMQLSSYSEYTYTSSDGIYKDTYFDSYSYVYLTE